MIRIGITGQNGFIGYHLCNTVLLTPKEFTLVPFDRDSFDDVQKLEDFVSACDVVVHLAALNRHNDPDEIQEVNLRLVRQLVAAMESTASTPHVVFSSSTQEERDNPYGRSKKEGNKLLADWATRNRADFTALVIPNVFGPFGRPYYNSVVATFCHQLTHNEVPKIDVDTSMNLIYVAELVVEIMQVIRTPKRGAREIKINHTTTIKVTDLLEKLNVLRTDYFSRGVFPSLTSAFERNLFNTFLTYIDHRSFFPFQLQKNSDARGSFVETVKLNSGGQVSFSTTVPGVTRGNHFHTRKAERFAVIKGKARIELRRIGTTEKISFDLDGDQPSFVDMPVWFTHNITNTGTEELYTIFWINEFYDQNDPDTWFENV